MSDTLLVLMSKEHIWCKLLLAMCCMSDNLSKRVLLVQSWWKAAQWWVSRPGTFLVIHPTAGGFLSFTALLCCLLLFAGWPSPSSSRGWGCLGCERPPQPQPCVSLMEAITSHLTVAAACSMGSLGVTQEEFVSGQPSCAIPVSICCSLWESTAAEEGLQEHP